MFGNGYRVNSATGSWLLMASESIAYNYELWETTLRWWRSCAIILSVTACRNRDRMDVDSMLEISREDVRRVITDNVNTIINTIVPEQFRLYKGNRKRNPWKPNSSLHGWLWEYVHWWHRQGENFFSYATLSSWRQWSLQLLEQATWYHIQ